VKVPFSWLLEYCDPGLPAEGVAALLSAKAVEVERVSTVGPPSADGFLVGRVVSAEKHPNADRLSVCVVDTGDGERTIVCGAPNVAAGQTVAVALPGAVLPGGQELGKAKLRGVESEGMILSETELELGDDADGIMVLDPADPGTPLSSLFAVSDQVLELELNPNRSDCLGVYGVAREVHAITGAPLAPPPWAEDAVPGAGGAIADVASVTVEAPELCPRFTVRAFEGATVGPSPLWLRARLRGAGQRSISNAVDVTNYVMLMTAQPLHAFDLDKVPGGELIIRTAREGEKMTTLDGVERVFDSESVLVCDRNGPSGIAGIMGGQVSEVSGETKRILLEVATWNGVNILRTSSMLGLRTDASARFEKQLHPELAMQAQRVASRLYTDLTGATMLEGTIDEAADIPAPHVVSLHGLRLDSLLGTHIELDEARAHLEALEFEVEPSSPEALAVTVPVHRHYDVTREADLIEEVGRLHGLDRLPRTLPAHGDRSGGLSREQVLRRRVEDAIAALGFDEIVAWHFVADDVPRRLGLDGGIVSTGNPISAEHSGLRTTLLGGLLDAAQHNVARDVERVAVFESGRIFLPEPAPAEGLVSAGVFAGRMAPPVHEVHRIGALAVGSLTPASWRGAGEAAGFYELKGVLEGVCAALGVAPVLAPARQPFLHPGRAAGVEIGGRPAGWIGELHPRVAAAWDLHGGAGFEVDAAALIEASGAGQESYEDVTTFPALYEDLAVVVGDEVPAAAVQAAVRGGGGELLRSARVFDLYRGAQVGEGRKSLALRLEFRAPDRTLTDEDVAPLREAIKEALAGLGGSLRE
jgi:phenylalanyl-tRNA synthetase beta chain